MATHELDGFGLPIQVEPKETLSPSTAATADTQVETLDGFGLPVQKEKPQPTEQRSKGLPLEEARFKSEEVDQERVKQVNKLTNKFGIGKARANTILDTVPFEQAMVFDNDKSLNTYYPGIANTMSPEFYKKYSDEPEWYKSIERATVDGLKYSGELLDTIGVGAKHQWRALLVSQLATGMSDKEALIKEIKDVDDGLAKNPFTPERTRERQSIAKSAGTFGKEVGPLIEAIYSGGKAVFGGRDSVSEFMEQVIKLKMEGDQEEMLDSMLEFGKKLYQHKGTAFLMAGESAASAAIPTIMGVAGSVVGSLVAPGAGSVVGGTVGGAVGAGIVGYTNYLNDQLVKHTEKGVIDYDAFLDPKNLVEYRKQAVFYGLGHAAVQALFLKFAGGSIVKQVKKPGAINTLKALAKVPGELVKQAPEEALGEVTALVAAKAAGGAISGEEIGTQGLLEAGLGGLGGASSNVLVGTVSKLAALKAKKNNVNTTFKEVHEVLVKADKARHQGLVVDKIQTLLKDSKTLAEDPQAVKDLINNIIEADSAARLEETEGIISEEETEGIINEEDTEDTISEGTISEGIISEEEKLKAEDGEENVAIIVRKLNKQADNLNEVVVRPEALERVAEEEGVEVLELISVFSPDLQNAYFKAKREGSSFRVPFADYLIATHEDPTLINQVAQFGGAEFTAKEAGEVREYLAANVGEMFNLETKTSDNASEITPGELSGFDLAELNQWQAEDGDPVLRPIYLTEPYRGTKEHLAFKRIFKKLKRSLRKSEHVKDEVHLHHITELAFRQLRKRAEVLDIPLIQLEADVHYIESTAHFEKQSEGNSYPLGSFTAYKGLPHKKLFRFGARSNVATVMHEYGHMWLHDLGTDWTRIHQIPEGELTDQQREIKEAMVAIASMLEARVRNHIDEKFELKTLVPVGEYTLPEPVYRYIHETWARTTENYFLKGKAENAEIRDALDTMRRWMVDSYDQSIYPQYPSMAIGDELNKVFSQIIDATRKEEGTKPMFDDALFDEVLLDLFGEKKAAAYKEKKKIAFDRVLGTIYEKAFIKHANQAKKEQAAIINKATDQAVDEFEQHEAVKRVREMEANPVAMKIKITDFQNMLIKVFGKELDLVSRKELTDKYMHGLPKKVFTTQKYKGITTEEMMARFSIADFTDFYNQIKFAAEEVKFINARVDQLVELADPSVRSEEELHELAVKEINGLGRERLLAMELDFLAKTDFSTFKHFTGVVINAPENQRRASQKKMKEQAHTLVLNNPYITPPKHYLQNKKALNKEAKRLFLSGDIAGALELKQKEMVQHFAFNLALGLQKKVAKFMDQQNKMLKTKDDKIKKVFAPRIYDFGRTIIKLQQSEGNTPFPTLAKQAFLEDLPISSEAVHNIDLSLDNYFKSNLDKRPENASMGDFLGFSEAVNRIRKEAKKAKTVQVQGRYLQRDAVGGKIGNELGKEKGGDGKFDFSKWKLKEWTTASGFFQGLFKDDKTYFDSTLFKIVSEIFNAEAVFNVHKRVDFRTLEASLTALAKTRPTLKNLMDGKGILGRGLELVGAGKQVKPIAAPEFGPKVFLQNEGQLMAVLLYGGSASGVTKLIGGGLNESGKIKNMTPEVARVKFENFINRMIEEGNLTKEHLDTANTIWGLFEKHYEPMKKAKLAYDGIELGKIEAVGMDTALGRINGGYYPTFRAEGYADLDRSIDDLFDDSQFNNTGDFVPMINSDSLNKRTNKLFELNLDLTRIPVYLHRIMQNAYLRNTLVDAGRMFTHPAVRTAMDSRRGNATKEFIIPWLQRIATQKYSTMPEGMSSEFLDVVARGAHKNAHRAIFLWNFGTVGRQLLGAYPAMKHVPPHRIVNAFTSMIGKATRLKTATGEDVLVGAMEGKRKEISAMSPFMKVRMLEGKRMLSMDDKHITLSGGLAGISDNIIETMTYWPIQFTQNLLDMLVWEAAYKQEAKRGKTNHEKAISIADEAVRSSQGDAAVSARAKFQLQSAVGKLLTPFMTQQIAVYNQNLVTNMRTADEHFLKREFYKNSVAFLTTTMPVITETVIGAIGLGVLLKAPMDDREDYYERMMAKGMVETVSARINPWIPGVIQTLLKNQEIQPALGIAKDTGFVFDDLSLRLRHGVPLGYEQQQRIHRVAMLFGIKVIAPVGLWAKVRKIVEHPARKKFRKKMRRKKARAARKLDEL